MLMKATDNSMAAELDRTTDTASRPPLNGTGPRHILYTTLSVHLQSWGLPEPRRETSASRFAILSKGVFDSLLLSRTSRLSGTPISKS